MTTSRRSRGGPRDLVLTTQAGTARLQRCPVVLTPDDVEWFYATFLGEPPTDQARSENGRFADAISSELGRRHVDESAVIAVLARGHDLRRHLTDLRASAAALSDAGAGRWHRSLLARARRLQSAEKRQLVDSWAGEVKRRLDVMRVLNADLRQLAAPFTEKTRISTEVARRVASRLVAIVDPVNRRPNIGLIAALLKSAGLLDEVGRAGSRPTTCWRMVSPRCRRTVPGQRTCSRDPLRCDYATTRLKELLRYRRGVKTRGI